MTNILNLLVLVVGLMLFTGCASTTELKAANDEVERLQQVESNYEEAKTELARLEQIESDYGARIQELERLSSEEKEVMREEMEAMRESLNVSLQEQISRNEALVGKVQDLTFIEIGENALFGSGQANLTEAGTQVIEKMSEALADYQGYNIAIEGHTDSVPIGEKLKSQFDTNWELSTARATNVVKYMIDKLTIEPSRLSAAGFAKYRPLAENETAEGRSKNRRIRIVVFKNVGI